MKGPEKGGSMNPKLYDIKIIETQSENNPYGDPDNGCPQEALQDFLNLDPAPEEDTICKGEHMFTIWRGEDPHTFFANAWSLPGEGKETEFTTYYEMKAREEV